VLYVLDEPSPSASTSATTTACSSRSKRLRDLGNTVIVVEHDEDAIRTADHVVDLGPGAGVHGGEIVAQGTLQDILNSPNSLTGQYLTGARRIEVPSERRKGNGLKITVEGARANNLPERHRRRSRSAPSRASPASPASASPASPSTRCTPSPRAR